MIALAVRRFVRSLWDGLVVLGLMHAAGEIEPDNCPFHDPVPGRTPPGLAPSPGHPERLRPDLPLTAQERRLRRELRSVLRRQFRESGLI